MRVEGALCRLTLSRTLGYTPVSSGRATMPARGNRRWWGWRGLGQLTAAAVLLVCAPKVEAVCCVCTVPATSFPGPCGVNEALTCENCFLLCAFLDGTIARCCEGAPDCSGGVADN